MALLFARHGNTFEAHEAPRIVGAHEDLPLTSMGEEQARELGAALKEAGLALGAVRSGPLIRTRKFAQIAAKEAAFEGPIQIDARLRELDFGAWTGLTDDEVAARFGQGALEAWRRHGARPADAGWRPDETAIRADLAALAEETAQDGATLCVTSNGVLRYVMELDSDAFKEKGQNGGFRVKTGRICAFRRRPSGLSLAFWDQKPEASLFARLHD